MLSCRLAGLLISLALGAGPVSAAYAFDPEPGQISLQDGKLSARFPATPLRQVMAEVSRLSGARVRWLSGHAEERPVSAEFLALSLPEALRCILGEISFLLFYTEAGESVKLTEIWISSGMGRGQPGPIPPPASQMKALLPTWDSASQGEDAERQAEFDIIPVGTLIQTAVSTAKLSLRVEAIAQLGGRVQEDPKVEGILSHLASNDSNPQVRAAAAEVLSGIE